MPPLRCRRPSSLSSIVVVAENVQCPWGNYCASLFGNEEHPKDCPNIIENVSSIPKHNQQVAIGGGVLSDVSEMIITPNHLVAVPNSM